MNNHIIDKLFHKSKHPNRELYKLYKQKKITIKDINGLIQSQMINPNNIWIKKIIKIKMRKLKGFKIGKTGYTVTSLKVEKLDIGGAKYHTHIRGPRGGNYKNTFIAMDKKDLEYHLKQIYKYGYERKLN